MPSAPDNGALPDGRQCRAAGRVFLWASGEGDPLMNGCCGVNTARPAWRVATMVLCAVGALLAGPARAQDEDPPVQVDVRQQDNTFVTQASFRLPLSMCQSWRFLTDYDSAAQIPGIVESRSKRVGERQVRVERVMQERILLIPIRMRSLIEYTELPGTGTDFVQIEGDSKSYRGSWRLEADGAGTVFRYRAVSEPDSALPMGVIRYFINNRLQSSFAAMARVGLARRQTACD